MHQWKKGVIRASLDRLPFFLCLLQDNPEAFISLKSLEGLRVSVISKCGKTF